MDESSGARLAAAAALTVAALMSVASGLGLGAPALAQSAARPTGSTAGATLERARPGAVDPGRAALPARPGPPGGGAVVGIAPGARFPLDAVRLEGATVYVADTLARFWEDRIGDEIGGAEAAEIAGAVQAFYRGEGYVFTRVVAARAANTLRLIVVEAQIESVAIEEPAGPVGPVNQLLGDLAEPLVGLRNPTLADLERVVLLMNDVPGVTRATAVPRAGTDGPGALALSFNVERAPFSGAVFADNRQQPTFGQGVAGAFVEWGSWSSAGDTTQLTFTNTFWTSIDDLEERNILEVTHSRNLGSHGARAGVRALASRNRPGDVLDPLGLAGEEFELEIFAEYPLIRTRPLSLWVRGGFELLSDQLRFEDTDETVSEDNIRVLYGEAELQQRDAYGFTEAVIGFRQGASLFGASEKGDANLSRFDGDPQATVVYGQIEREVALTEMFAVYGLVAGQYADSPLLGGEEFALGGTTFGRGYDPSEALGDHGVGATFEIRARQSVEVEQVPIDAEFYAFTDVGKVWNRGDGTPEENDLSSVGFGVRALIDRLTFIEAEVAKPVEPLIRTDSDSFRFFLTAQRRF